MIFGHHATLSCDAEKRSLVGWGERHARIDALVEAGARRDAQESWRSLSSGRSLDDRPSACNAIRTASHAPA